MWVGPLEGGALAVEMVAAGQDFHEDFFRAVFGEAEKLLPDLLRQLPGGRDDQDLDATVFRVDPHQQRNAEGGGLAGAGLRLGDEVPAIRQEKRNRFGLNRGGRSNAQFLHAGDQIIPDAQCFKCFQGVIVW